MLEVLGQVTMRGVCERERLISVASYNTLSARYLLYWCISQDVIYTAAFLLQSSPTETQCALLHRGSIPSLVLAQAMLQWRLHVLWRLRTSSLSIL